MTFATFIRGVAADFLRISQNRRYVIDPGLFHSPRREGCHVCLAGAWLAGKGVDRGKQFLPSSFGRGSDTANIMFGLDQLRVGNLTGASNLFRDAGITGGPTGTEEPPPLEEVAVFHAWLLELAEDTERRGR